NIYYPVDLKNSSEHRKHVSSILCELKPKDLGMKSKTSRHLIQKDLKKYIKDIVKKNLLWI
ncbi:LRRIQ3 isoform 10, partial [Pan troglodytes]